MEFRFVTAFPPGPIYMIAEKAADAILYAAKQQP